jgi:hypothetical protein
MVSRVPGQHQQRQSIGRKQALVSHVVDGENGSDFVECGVLGIERAQHHRDERGLPVVAVEDLRHSQHLGGFEYGARKHGEALGVIGIISGGSAVESFAVEVGRIIHEVKLNPGWRIRARGDDRAEAILVVEGDGDAAHDSLRVGEFGLTIARNVDAHLMSQSGQGTGQGADHVG